MSKDSSDPRRKAILQAATTAFASYGYRKTSMDDIARAAGMSRPALYLHYRNKEEIFRTMVDWFYAEAAMNLREALATGDDRPIAAVLSRAFRAQGGDLLALLMQSPHGMELFDAGSLVALDIAQAGERTLTGIYADWLHALARAGRIAPPEAPEAAARAMTAALKGLKFAADDYDSYVALLEALAALIGPGLERREPITTNPV
ncbi:TetR/AcrR family transcriptional regulator [Chachezhania sediminis]|uniref:TetR/AcrR family transcriptional regulator n=1 Tax=Chachezhania sediminis TaxID=2599291 RepID=UPI00131CF212|nr:TetR/AcrR family transcriptional regulator [Chachezhania sediminis]